MTAEQLLDSKAFCAKLEALIKANTETSRAETLQAVLDAAIGSPVVGFQGPPIIRANGVPRETKHAETIIVSDKQKRKRRTKAEMLAVKGAKFPKPTPKVEPNPAIQDMNSISAEERARIFDLEAPGDPPIPHKATPEQMRQAHLEAFNGKLEQLKPLLPTMPIGKKAFAILPSDFPVQDLPSYLDRIGGYTTTDKAPESLAILARQARAVQGKHNGPNEGWKIELQRVP